MRTALLTIAAALSAAGLAAPASAQWFPQPYGHAYGYTHYNPLIARSLDARVDQVRRHVFNMNRRYLLAPSQARRLDREAISIKHRIWSASRNGLSFSERRSLDRRIDRLERRVRIEVARNSRYGPRYAYAYRR